MCTIGASIPLMGPIKKPNSTLAFHDLLLWSLGSFILDRLCFACSRFLVLVHYAFLNMEEEIIKLQWPPRTSKCNIDFQHSANSQPQLPKQFDFFTPQVTKGAHFVITSLKRNIGTQNVYNALLLEQGRNGRDKSFIWSVSLIILIR